MSEYVKFAVDVLIHMAIIGVMLGIIISLIGFIGGFGFWIWDKIRKEKSQWKNWDK